MTGTDQHKPGEKSGKRKQKQARKKEQQKTAPEKVAAKREPIEAALTPPAPEETVESMAAVEAAPAEPAERTAAVEAAPAEPVERVAVEAVAAEPVERVADPEPAPAKPVERVASFRERMASVMPPADTARGNPPAPADIATAVPSPPPAAAPAAGIQALANAYRDYTRKSLADAQSFAEKLSAARTLDKAVEAQTEFARKACETFATDAQKIRDLHRQLFWQAFTLPGWPLGRTGQGSS